MNERAGGPEEISRWRQPPDQKNESGAPAGAKEMPVSIGTVSPLPGLRIPLMTNRRLTPPANFCQPCRAYRAETGRSVTFDRPGDSNALFADLAK